MRRSLLALALLSLSATAQPDPPFSGTIFLDPDIVVASDPSSFQTVTFTGRGDRTLFDRRVDAWITVRAYLYRLTFADGHDIEVQVNPEFGSEEAGMEQAAFYGPRIGQLPIALRRSLTALWLHQGREPFGGGFGSLLIHAEQAALFERDGILEETLIHEAAHTSLDAEHARSDGWRAAQAADSTFISRYARDNPTREDIAESFVTYLAIRYRQDRISQDLYDTITATIPNRIAYFDALNLDMRPVAEFGPEPPESPEPEEPEVPDDLAAGLAVGPNPIQTETTVWLTLEEAGPVYVDVLDGLGRIVATLASGEFEAGETPIVWRLGGLPAGAYAVRARAQGTVYTRMVSVQK